MTDFDKAVAAFTKKKKSQDVATLKRDAYRKLLKEYNEMKYGPAVGGVRKERQITQELIDRREADKKLVSKENIDDLVSSLTDFINIPVAKA
jgi:hypothetical protein